MVRARKHSFKTSTFQAAAANTSSMEGIDDSADDVDGEPVDDVDGVPMQDDIDGEPVDDGEPVENLDREPLEDIDGEPMEDVDGEPMEDVDGPFSYFTKPSTTLTILTLLRAILRRVSE